MKKAKKVLLLALCAVLLVGATIAGTVAYLTSTTTEVKNTFTAGNVTIELKEKEMNPETGELVKDGGLVGAIEEIKIVPNRTIFKQPVVIVKDGSEDCWLFVKVEGELLKGGSFAVNENWEAVDGQTNWYRYKANNGKATVNDDGYQVFNSFTFENLTNEQVTVLNGETIKVTAYAVQYERVDQDEALAAALGMVTPAN